MRKNKVIGLLLICVSVLGMAVVIYCNFTGEATLGTTIKAAIFGPVMLGAGVRRYLKYKMELRVAQDNDNDG